MKWLIGTPQALFSVHAPDVRLVTEALLGATLSLLNLAGAIALLLWGVHMVQSGVQRAFGPDLRRFLARALGNRVRAAAAGLGVTAILQSSTPRV
jgi:Na+/phosphate symporter